MLFQYAVHLYKTLCRKPGSEWTLKQNKEVRNTLDKNDYHTLVFVIWKKRVSNILLNGLITGPQNISYLTDIVRLHVRKSAN